ncbi:sensor histidine kinase [Siphonobacter aquaeclarae]|uniref:7TM diverse intracellular signalling n=1 Tax=Siphonobacter aquaeclarae TaxID=563176 RepID=A0A1G9W5Q1_9BACT|nr:histidine kinase [Siphonobacter aquaeclarae]SDM79864.1 7TM diverse intracellular signalling [Siphonobacter aquaeclarae]
MTFDTWNIAFVGMVTSMLLFNIMQWYSHRERVYGYYTLFMLLWLGYFVLRQEGEAWLREGTYHFVRVAVPMMAYFVYYDFSAVFTRLRDEKLLKLFSRVQALLTVYVLVEMGLCFFSEGWRLPVHEYLHIAMRTILILASGYIIWRMAQAPDRVIRYFVAGSLLLVLFGAIAMVTTITGIRPSTPLRPWEAPLFYMQIGIILELLCFSLGLAYRHRRASIEKAVVFEQLAREREQLERERLETKLAAQQTHKLLSDLRMKALRAQMNPHFLFNSLNAIQECILTEQTDAAASYLAKFSKLVRLILESSDKQMIPLSSEIESLRLYLDVESLRFTQAFFYEILVHTHIDASLINIPPMLVQPYAENAIWHGLLHKEGDRKLTISFFSDDEFLYIEIQDNGIGRAKAGQEQNPLKKEYESRGMKLTDERLQALSEREGVNAFAEVEDLADPAGRPAGTRVMVTLPI